MGRDLNLIGLHEELPHRMHQRLHFVPAYPTLTTSLGSLLTGPHPVQPLAVSQYTLPCASEARPTVSPREAPQTTSTCGDRQAK